MRIYDNGWAELELTDLIRINQLVRRTIDFPQFQRWYESLEVAGQAALAAELAELAHQAGFDEALYAEAMAEAGFEAGDPLLAGPRRPAYGRLLQLPDRERALAFKQAVYLFGKAEGSVYRRETKASCNHWWHRNLLDERVVRAILNDPSYSRTAMRDDDQLDGLSA